MTLTSSLWSVYNSLYFIWTELWTTHMWKVLQASCMPLRFMCVLTWSKFRDVYWKSLPVAEDEEKPQIPLHSVLITYIHVIRNSKETFYFHYFTTQICRKVKGTEILPYSSQLIRYEFKSNHPSLLSSILHVLIV